MKPAWRWAWGSLAVLAACSSSSPVSDDGGSRDAAKGAAGAGAAGAAGAGAAGAADAAGAGAAGAVGSGGAGGQALLTFPPFVNHYIDVLFMIDDSTGMSLAQSKLAAAFSSYIDTLRFLPAGFPDVNIAVVSSSMGAGRSTTIDHCPSGGDRGVFHTAPLGTTCAHVSIDPPLNFISEDNGLTNVPNGINSLADALACITPLGSSGCGFEHQLASIARALGADGQPPPPENAGFLRPFASLQVVVLSDEDDCSAPPDSDLFDPSSMLVSDPLGPLQSYRCNEFGHLCGGKAPPRTPAGPTDLSGTCVSNDNGRLLRVSDFVNGLKALKDDPSKVYVAAISAPPTPYVVNVGPSGTSDPSMWPYVQHSCMAADGTYGDPAVRLKQWVDAFGNNGIFESICADSYAPAMKRIGGQVGQAMAQPCLAANVDSARCTFVDHFVDAQGQRTDAALRPCANGTDHGPCWTVFEDATQCPNGQKIFVPRPGGSPLPLNTTVNCP